MDKLKAYRRKIDIIDKNIVKLLSLRFRLIKRIANHKKKHKIKIVDKERESQVINNIKKHSNSNQKFINNIFKDIIKYSKKIQHK